MQAIKTPKQSLTKTQQSLRVSLPQENHTTCAPCFAEGSSVLAHAKRLEVASPYSSSLRVWCTRCWWNVETFALLAITCISPASLPSLGSNTLALGSCLIASKDKAITKATTSGSVITEPTTQASASAASSASSASLRPFGVTCICSAPCVQPSHFKLPHKSLRLCVSAGNNNIRMNMACSVSFIFDPLRRLPTSHMDAFTSNQ